MFYYKLFGLKTASEIELPEVEESTELFGQVDVVISEKVMPEHIKDAKKKGYHSSFKGKEFCWLHFLQEGDYYIHQGKMIDIDLNEIKSQEDMINVRQTILGRCFGEILFQRDQIAIHGSAVCDDKFAYIISGKSGSGKSTLTNELINKGFKFMADDTVPIHIENDITYVSAGYPQQKICSDLALRLGYQVEKLILLNEERQKYAISMLEYYCEKDMPFACMIVLEESEYDEVEFKEITGTDKLQCFLYNLYCIQKYSYTNINPALLKECMNMLKKARMFKIKRPKNKDTVERIATEFLEMV